MMLLMLPLSATGAQRPADLIDQSEVETLADATAAERLYPDAPAGVDPITTGPVSREFRERQRAARCDEAVWPNIPIACYP